MLSLGLMGCSTAPKTGRSQLTLIPQSELFSMSEQQYQQFLQSHEKSDNEKDREMIKRVGWRIQKATEQYFTEKGDSEILQGYEWEFHLVKDEAANAWCMPGGRVVFYTGILPLTQNETGVATVMGHEIAHAVADHGNERMSQQLLVGLGAFALNEALSEKPDETKKLFMGAYGLGSSVGVLLPYSREHELEADYLGLIFMAKAGYNPEEAVEFWERMAARQEQNPPEFLSTHPSNQQRIEKIKKHLPEAMKIYRASQ